MDAASSKHLERAVALAQAARDAGNHPFGATFVAADGRAVDAQNTVVTAGDPTGHAETNLVRLAASTFTLEELAAGVLYTSTEPCAMCSGAIFWAGIGAVVYALGSDELNEMVPPGGEFTLDLHAREIFARGGHPTVVTGPIDLPGAREVHAGFWG